MNNAAKRAPAGTGRATGFLAPYLALCAFFAVAAELAMEVHGFGFESSKPLLSERHGVLALVLGVAVAIIAKHAIGLLRQSAGPRELKRRLRLEFEALPFGAKGWRFVALTIGVNFVFGVLAHYGERSPDLDGDAVGWLISALIVAVLMAFTTRAILHRLPDLVATVIAFFMRLLDTPRPAYVDRTGDAMRATFDAWPPTFFSRPPPIPQL